MFDRATQLHGNRVISNMNVQVRAELTMWVCILWCRLSKDLWIVL